MLSKNALSKTKINSNLIRILDMDWYYIKFANGVANFKGATDVKFGILFFPNSLKISKPETVFFPPSYFCPLEDKCPNANT